MAALTPAVQDRLFFLGVGLTACAVIGLMRRMLIASRQAAIIPPAENKPQYITQEVEDSLKLSTLDKLLDSPNYAIQETAAIIVCERALHDGSTINILLWYITQPDYKSREQGIRALSMMMNSSTIRMLNSPATYAALIKSLEFSITDYVHNDFSPDWDNWHLRDVVEQGNLLLLSQLTHKFGPEGLVKHNFVSRWLAKEPWGQDEHERFSNFLSSLDGRYRLSEMLEPLFLDRTGRKQLIKAKLVPPRLRIADDPKRDTRMAGGGGAAGEDNIFDGMFVEGTRRPGQSFEEEHIRRRHREAMVLNDGTRPLERGDIIQRER